ncbi:MAG: lipocalin-like domain-containing protein [Phycisphaerae bacterium]|nr:lipocalin-like domain-containing protein [Gemmatimonadaceae bacterium]
MTRHSCRQPTAAATAADSVRGTWRLLPYPTCPGSDSIAPPFGRTPVGYLVYEATGHVFWQVMRRSAMDSLQSGMRRGVPDTTLYRLSRAFSAQFGTYSVDINQRTVTHQYEGESVPWGTSFEVATPFRLSADSLFIGRDTLTWLRFIRVR